MPSFCMSTCRVISSGSYVPHAAKGTRVGAPSARALSLMGIESPHQGIPCLSGTDYLNNRQSCRNKGGCCIIFLHYTNARLAAAIPAPSGGRLLALCLQAPRPLTRGPSTRFAVRVVAERDSDSA
jgi:hypothetical protein